EQVFQRGSRSRIELVMGYTSRGAPIDWVPLEPVVFVRDTVSVAGRPPHPATTKFIRCFPVFQRIAVEAARNESHSRSSRRRARPTASVQGLQAHPAGYRAGKFVRVYQPLPRDFWFTRELNSPRLVCL